jgi:xanthine dehydrogenase accessory factor
MAASDHTILEQAARWLTKAARWPLPRWSRPGARPRSRSARSWRSTPTATFIGSVSGGCVEGAVVTEALDVIASGKPKVLAFGVADETAWEVGLACGGKIRIYVEPLTRRAGRHEPRPARSPAGGAPGRRAVALVTDLETGAQRLVGEDDAPEDVLSAALVAGFRFDQRGDHEYRGRRVLHQHLQSAAQARHRRRGPYRPGVIPIARLAGYDVTVIDPRGAFASPSAFPT